MLQQDIMRKGTFKDITEFILFLVFTAGNAATSKCSLFPLGDCLRGN